MSEKMWGEEPFWGLGYEWDPDWVLTDRQKELRDEADRALRARDAGEREALRRRAALPAPQLRAAGRERLPQPHRARGVRRAGREPCRVLDGLRDPGPLRLRVDRDVLRDAHRRGRDDHAPPHPRAGRQATSARWTATAGSARSRTPIPQTGSHFWYPFSSECRAHQRRLQGQQEVVVDDLGRLCRLLRRADHEPRLLRLRRPLRVRDRRRRRARRSPRSGTRSGCAATSRARSRSRTSRSRPTRSSARSATAPPPTTRRSTPGSWSAPPPSGTGSRWGRSTSPGATRPASATSTSACGSPTTRRSRTTSARR